jgi:hypothetical protein
VSMLRFTSYSLRMGLLGGDSRVIGDLHVRRKNIESLLALLESTSSDQEFDSMLKEILSPANVGDPFVYTMAHKINMVREESGTQAARAKVAESLRVARERETSGNF